MADTIREQHPGASVELIDGGRGDFIVTADDAVIWDKKRDGGFPRHDEIIKRLA